MRTDRFLEDEAGPSHELLAELLPAPVREVLAGNKEALTRRHVLADLVHFSVDDPPLRLILRRLAWSRPGLRSAISLRSGSGVRSEPSDALGG